MARPPKFNERQESRSITAPATLWAIAKKIGKGNISEGVQIALEMMRKKK